MMDNTNLRVNVTGLDMIRRDDEPVDISGLDSIRHVFQNDLPPVSQFAVELIRLVSDAKNLDPELKLLGSENHRYQFAPVAALSDVRDFELRHNITLPPAYVEFLTQVGNGGAGPDLGLFSLDELEFCNYYVHSGRSVPYAAVREEEDYYSIAYSDNMPVLLDSGLTEAKWNSLCAELDSLNYNNKEKEYLQKRHSIFNGTLKIVNSFDSSGILLICSGDMCGQVAMLSDDLSMPHYHGQSFENWLLSYFKDVIRKFSH